MNRKYICDGDNCRSLERFCEFIVSASVKYTGARKRKNETNASRSITSKYYESPPSCDASTYTQHKFCKLLKYKNVSDLILVSLSFSIKINSAINFYNTPVLTPFLLIPEKTGTYFTYAVSYTEFRGSRIQRCNVRRRSCSDYPGRLEKFPVFKQFH